MYLPQVQSDHSDAIVFIDFAVSSVFWIINLRVHPFPLVSRIVNLVGFPLTLEKIKNSISKIKPSIHCDKAMFFWYYLHFCSIFKSG